jgi:hypothetical protein
MFMYKSPDTLQKARNITKRKEANPDTTLESSEPSGGFGVKKPRKRKPIVKYTYPLSSGSSSDQGASSSSDIEEPSSKFGSLEGSAVQQPSTSTALVESLDSRTDSIIDDHVGLHYVFQTQPNEGML